MNNLRILASVAAALGLYATILAQGGPMGGGGYGGGGFGGGGMSQGPGGNSQQTIFENVGRSIDGVLASYLGNQETKSILTPGEYCEWKLVLKANQVVITDANSDMFDPAIEIVDSQDKVLATNDDRYPGDQRPLLLFRCTADGSYSLRIRCFKNKSGGQFTSRSRVYDAIDTDPDKMVDFKVAPNTQYLIRIPMKAGQFREIEYQNPDPKQRVDPNISTAISPIGLPVSTVERQDFTPLRNSLIAPVDGDYYYLMTPSSNGGLLRIGTRLLTPLELKQSGEVRTGKARTGTHSVWRVPAKAGDLLEFSTPDLYYACNISIWEEPDFKSFDLKDPEKNPFFPKTKEPDHNLTYLDARDRQNRYQVRAIKKDMVLWAYTTGIGSKTADYSLFVKPAAMKLEEGKRLTPRLPLDTTDYWQFDASIGDVMTIDATTASFVPYIEILNPDLKPIAYLGSDPDLTPMHYTMTVTTPGRYVLRVKSSGGGGGGEYTLNRKVIPAKEFAKGSPARGEITKDEVHVWKFTVKPGQPVVFREYGDSSSIGFSVVSNVGQDRNFGMSYIDAMNRYAIFNTNEPTTYVVIVSGFGLKSNYRLELLDLPGLTEAKK